MSGISNKRSLTYWFSFIVFLMIGGPVYAIDGTISGAVHELLD